jgi:hypothetical protein
LAGITAAGDALVDGASLALLFAAGEDDLVGDGEAEGFGVGDSVFSVVTETLGSEVVASGEAAGDGLSSWAKANVTATANNALSARTVIFMWFSFWNLGGNS